MALAAGIGIIWATVATIQGIKDIQNAERTFLLATTTPNVETIAFTTESDPED